MKKIFNNIITTIITGITIGLLAINSHAYSGTVVKTGTTGLNAQVSQFILYDDGTLEIIPQATSTEVQDRFFDENGNEFHIYNDVVDGNPIIVQTQLIFTGQQMINAPYGRSDWTLIIEQLGREKAP